MANIGIFWCLEGKITGRSRFFKEGECNLPGLWDSPDNHIDLWECEPESINLPVYLRQLEYQVIPRGRLIYDQRRKISLVYMDRSLFNDASKEAIQKFFKLEGKKLKWCKDPHYRVYSPI